ncbi:DNA adenine methylase [Xanthomonas arboricola]|uniref:DNA adenine methylase n=1 Tax=Xanthomonas cannabis TaxID=1885674 RepID=UPI001610D82E|nr:DNA adenine methylase [Xanthomonas cannabis]MBB3804274.1 DNA adenine methylase [Xanthomonas cannabis]
MGDGKDGNFYSPLRYPGGKGRMGPWLASLMRANGLEGGCYVEPYAGGAGAALYLLLRGHAKRIVINDADPAIYAFWTTLVGEPDELIRLIWAHAPTMESRAWAQQVLQNIASYTPAEVGFAAFFLNRTSRSGILNGGVIGGKEQAGQYKLDARYNRDRLVARINAIAAHADRIRVYGLDALKLFSKIKSKLPKKTLIYMDPPYYVKGSQLYRNCYEHGDHELVAQAARGLKQPFVITYDDTSEIRQIYKGMKSTLFSLRYSTHLARPLTSEVLFYNNLSLPMPPVLTRRVALQDCA